MQKRLWSFLWTAAFVCLNITPVSAEQTEGFTEGETGDGYYYTEFAANQQGTHQLTLGDYGAFSCEWDGIFNYRAEVGNRFQQFDSFAGVGGLEFTYSGSALAKGNCYYGVHGSFGSDMPEIYIVEGWGSWRPPGGQNCIGTGTVRNKIYDYYEGTEYLNPAVENSPIIKTVYAVATSSDISQNRECKLSRTTDFTSHIENLAKIKSSYSKLFNAKLEYAAMFAEGYGSYAGDSSCKLTVDRIQIRVYPNPVPVPVPTDTDERIAADQNGVFFLEDFENGIGNAGQYGETTTLDIMPHYHVDGAQSLAVTNRSAEWNGVGYWLDDYAVRPDTSYSFQTALMQETENEVTFRLMMQYPDKSGVLQYKVLETAEAKRGEWVILRCPDFQVPSDGSKDTYVKDTRLFIDTFDGIADYYADSMCLSEAGALPEISLADCVPPLPEETGIIPTPIPKDTPEYDPDGDGLKDYFGQYFRIGGMISEQYLKTDAAKESVKKHFNSLCCSFGFGLGQQNSIKAVNGTEVTVDVSGLTPILGFAEQNGIPVRGTNYFTNPTDWDAVSDDVFLNTNTQDCNARIESLMKNTFAAIVSQHPNLKLYAFDVCTHVARSNSEAGFYMPGGELMHSIYGDGKEESIIQAFKCARKYAPRATKLYLCDHQTGRMGEDAELEALVKKIMQEGDYIDGVSLKAVVGSDTDLSAYGNWLKKLSALGMDIQFADIRVRDEADYSGASMRQVWKRFFAMAADDSDEISCVTLGRPTVFMLNYDEGPTALFNGNSETGEITPVMDFSELADTIGEQKGKIGDVNCDGTVDVADAVLVMRFAVADREAVITDQGLRNADTDRNGHTDAEDGVNILKYIAKKITFPVKTTETSDQPKDYS